MLTFSNPLIFWFLPALALPWIFRRRKEERIKHVQFPLLHFLKASEEKELVNPHLQELLLLILRTLLLALLLLALSGPKWITGNMAGQALFSFLPLGKAFQTNTIAIDSSYSMAYGEGGDSWWQNARQGWRAVESNVSGFSTNRIRWDRSTTSAGQLLSMSKQDMESVFLGVPNQEGTSITELVKTIDNSFEERTRLVLITDGQRWPWEALLNQEIHPNAFSRMLVLTVGQPPARNTWFEVESLSLPPWGIAGWETIAGRVLSLHESEETSATVSIYHGETKEHLYSKPISLPPAKNEVAQLSFSFTALLSKLIGESNAMETGEDLSFTIHLEPNDLLPIDNKMTLQVPLVSRFTYGIPCNPQVENQARRVLTTAMNPLEGTAESPPVRVDLIPPPFDQISSEVDFTLIAREFTSWWSHRETEATMNYIKNGGTAMIFLGEKEEDDPYWQPFLTQLGWTWHPTADEKPSIEPVTVSGSSLFAETLRMWDQTMWEPWLSSTQTHGLLAGETAQPFLSYQVGDKPCTLLGQVRLGKGTGWIVNSSLNEKSEILLSPILPALLWETAKQVARDRRDAELDIPQAKRESNIQLLSETDKKQIQEKYPIQFTTMETLRDGLDSLQGGMDLRMVFLFLCIVIAIMESWLANRLASM